jgi:hypothetical protein
MLNYYDGMLMVEKMMECSVTLATPPNGETLTDYSRILVMNREIYD